MIIKDGQNGILMHREYESLQEIFNLKIHEKNIDHRTSVVFLPENEAKVKDDSRAWRGGLSSLEELGKFINKGWKDGLDKMRETIGQVSIPTVKSVKRRGVWSDEGDDLEISRVWGGQLDTAWRTTNRVAGGAPRHVSIWVNSSADRGKRPDELFWRGAVACILVDALEQAGYRAQIGVYEMTTGCFKESDDSLDQCAKVILKPFDANLDLEQVAAATAHASFLRIGWFATKLASSFTAVYHLGMPYYGKPPFAEEGDIWINKLFSLEEAREFLKKNLARYNAE